MRCTAPSPLTGNDMNAAPAQPESFSYRELTGDRPVIENRLPSESALSISYNGINQAVMMVTPGNLEDFIRGFTLSTGVIEHFREVHDIRIRAQGEAYFADVDITNRAFWNLKTQRRHLAGTTGCGICGVEAIEQALPDLEPLQPSLPPSENLFAGLRMRIQEAQLAAKQSGALHAALYVDPIGEIALCREDIGRHNALDKLIGAMADQHYDPQQGFVVVTSRCSLELIHKAVRAKVATLVSLSAPTALTVQWARRNHLNLIHLPQSNVPRLYSPAP